MVYAIGTFLSVTPDSSVKEGTVVIRCSVTRLANGFSGWDVTVSTGFSILLLVSRPEARLEGEED